MRRELERPPEVGEALSRTGLTALALNAGFLDRFAEAADAPEHRRDANRHTRRLVGGMLGSAAMVAASIVRSARRR